MIRLIRRFARDRAGATAIEYAMIGALISLAVIAGGSLIGKSLANDFNNANNGLVPASS